MRYTSAPLETITKDGRVLGYQKRALIDLRKPLDPIKVCCGRRMSEHSGAQCPDGKVMCCICFERFDVTALYTYPGHTTPSDVCQPCGEHDQVRAQSGAP